MPFGSDCEYPDFDACVAANSGKDDPEGYCAELQRATEESCSQRADGEKESPESHNDPARERRSLPVEFRVEADLEGQRRILWYPALFDVVSEDLGGFRERIGRRAFTKTLQSDDVRALINHEPNLILARTSAGTLSLHVDLRGLHAEATLPDTSYANDLIANIENGNIKGGSFAFMALQDKWAMETSDAGEEVLVRTLIEARLYDVSPVTFPAYSQTEGSVALRSLAEEWREKLSNPEADWAKRRPHISLHRKRYLDLLKLKVRR